MATLKTIYNSGNSGATVITSNTGVQSVNGASGSVNIAAGTGISVTESGQTITIANTEAAGGVTSVTTSGAGITATPTTGAVVLANTGVTSISAANSGISVSAGSGSVGISNTGVLSITAGTGISTNISSGNYTLNNTGITGVEINGGSASSNGNLNLIAGSNVTLSQTGLGVTIASSAASGVSSITGGNGISISPSSGTGAVTIGNAGVTSNTAGAAMLVSTNPTGASTITNNGLWGVEVNTSGTVAQGVNLNLIAGGGVTLSQTSGDVTISNSGVTSLEFDGITQLTGALVIRPGTNIAFNTSGNTITIQNTGPTVSSYVVPSGSAWTGLSTGFQPYVYFNAVLSSTICTIIGPTTGTYEGTAIVFTGVPSALAPAKTVQIDLGPYAFYDSTTSAYVGGFALINGGSPYTITLVPVPTPTVGDTLIFQRFGSCALSWEGGL